MAISLAYRTNNCLFISGPLPWYVIFLKVFIPSSQHPSSFCSYHFNGLCPSEPFTFPAKPNGQCHLGINLAPYNDLSHCCLHYWNSHLCARKADNCQLSADHTILRLGDRLYLAHSLGLNQPVHQEARDKVRFTSLKGMHFNWLDVYSTDNLFFNRMYSRQQRRARLEFGTKLGMNSPFWVSLTR